MLVKTENGNKDVAIKDVTPENYIVPKGEESLYHVAIEVKMFNPHTGERLSAPRIQKFGKKTYEEGGEESLRLLGYNVIVLHDPRKFLAEQAEKADAARIEAEKRAKENAEAKAKADAEAKAKAREALKAEIRAEVMAELKAEASTKKGK